ncbi:hypothetical protein BC829DRAFT_480896 [Chytridium lagenaria]|nr:hypothetical protein BC829DRAFT_480896 [Chytridium lagenaria]
MELPPRGVSDETFGMAVETPAGTPSTRRPTKRARKTLPERRSTTSSMPIAPGSRPPTARPFQAAIRTCGAPILTTTLATSDAFEELSACLQHSGCQECHPRNHRTITGHFQQQQPSNSTLLEHLSSVPRDASSLASFPLPSPIQNKRRSRGSTAKHTRLQDDVVSAPLEDDLPESAFGQSARDQMRQLYESSRKNGLQSSLSTMIMDAAQESGLITRKMRMAKAEGMG